MVLYILSRERTSGRVRVITVFRFSPSLFFFFIVVKRYVRKRVYIFFFETRLKSVVFRAKVRPRVSRRFNETPT